VREGLVEKGRHGRRRTSIERLLIGKEAGKIARRERCREGQHTEDDQADGRQSPHA
jgi:hypothetical protein